MPQLNLTNREAKLLEEVWDNYETDMDPFDADFTDFRNQVELNWRHDCITLRDKIVDINDD